MKTKRVLILILLGALALSWIPNNVSADSDRFLPRTSVVCDSEFNGAGNACTKSIDGNTATYWLSTNSAYPHNADLTLDKSYVIISVKINEVTLDATALNGEVYTWTGSVWALHGTWTGQDHTNFTVTLDSPQITNKIRIKGTVATSSTFMSVAEFWGYGHSVPVCAFGTLGTTTDLLIPILVSAALITFTIGFFLIAFESKGSGKKSFSMELLVIGSIGLVIVIAVAASLITSMRLCP